MKIDDLVSAEDLPSDFSELADDESMPSISQRIKHDVSSLESDPEPDHGDGLDLLQDEGNIHDESPEKLNDHASCVQKLAQQVQRRSSQE